MNEQLQIKEKPPYLLGLLCFIPLIGAFVGFGLLLFAIFKYRDKLLGGIGIFGILFTMLIYGGLFYYSAHTDEGKKQWTQLSQIGMNNLVKEIEFYKVQNNHYPDSLDLLSTKENTINIYDPVLGLRDVGHLKYNYEIYGSHYRLFSSGPDGIKNTADDIYPTLEIKDSSKAGLIK